MRQLKIGLGIVACWFTVIILLPATANAAVYGGGNGHTRVYTTHAFDSGLHKRWSLDMGGILEYPPVSAGGVLYTGQDNGRVSAVKDGAYVWRTTNQHTEFSDSPAVGSSTLYLGSRGRNSGVWAFSRATGAYRWHSVATGQSEASPVLVKGRLVVAGGLAVCSLRLNGSVAWCRAGLGKVTGSPVVAGGSVYVASYGGWVYRLALSGGRTIWRHAVGGTIYAGMALRRNHLIIAARDRGSVVALNARSGAQLWQTVIGDQPYGSPAVTASGWVYATWRGRKASPHGGFAKLKLSNGKLVWHHQAAGMVMCSPTVIGSRVWFSTMGAHFTKGTVDAYVTSTMHKTFHAADGRYTPAIPSAGTLVLVGMGTLYGYST